MSSPAESAAGVSRGLAARLRALPSVDELLSEPAVAALIEKAGREIATHAARNVLEDLRVELKSDPASSLAGIGAIATRVARAMEAALAPSLRAVINATGVVLHTNLGRAPLSSPGNCRNCPNGRGLFQPRIRSRARRARQARRAHGAPPRADHRRRSRDRGQQQRRCRLSGAEHPCQGPRGDRLARRTHRNRRRLPHPGHHVGERRCSSRGGHHQPHPASAITSAPSTNALACFCACTLRISTSRDLPAGPRSKS